MKSLIVLMLLGVSLSLWAQTVYKSTGPNGEIIYSATPPAGSRVEKTLNYIPAPFSPLPDYALRFKEEMEKKMRQRELKQTSTHGGIQLFTTSWCGFCRKAKAYLAQKQIAYTEYDVETPAGMEALLQTGEKGRRGVPLLVWQGQKLYGFSERAYEALLSK